jgi:hypothetical protein
MALFQRSHRFASNTKSNLTLGRQLTAPHIRRKDWPIDRMATRTGVRASILNTGATMKKLVAFTAALSLASSVFVLPTAASAAPNLPGNPNNGIAAYCSSAQGAVALGISQGNCVQLISYFLATGGGLTPNANAFCHFWQSNAPAYLPPFNFTSFGQCTSATNAFFHS